MFFFSLNLILTFSILFMNHPISLGFIILLYTISSCCFMGMFSFNFWFSYILIIIMIGGLLILFIYMTSLASNEKFNLNWKFLVIIPLIIMISWLMKNFDYLDSLSLSFNMIENKNFFLSMSKYYNLPNLKLLMLMIIYLLISMIAVIKISMNNKGPLRQNFYDNTNP
uniref:NADH-ubiquinone oxidoreductase chain 6 n=1 Tax=Cucujoidea sp. 10 KM-2017 TaxID=2219346 RepID=A0A346RJR9_9CUCU|nr:NADH dehydrogenase subunit 6 [Cucujoidea sp. 10 KM-2017]